MFPILRLMRIFGHQPDLDYAMRPCFTRALSPDARLNNTSYAEWFPTGNLDKELTDALTVVAGTPTTATSMFATVAPANGAWPL